MATFFCQTQNTPIARLRTPLSFIILVLNALNEGLSINATARTFGTSKKSIKRWLERLGKGNSSAIRFMSSVPATDCLRRRVVIMRQL